MPKFASTILCLFAAMAAQAFDSAEWLGKRQVLLREAERLSAAYSNCLSRVKSPAEDVTVPVETFADGSVKTVVAAKRAQFFLHEGLVWAEGVKIRKFRADGSQEALVEAERCVVDRSTKSGWAQGKALVVHGGTVFRGEDVYFSSPESFVHVGRNMEMESDDIASGKGLAL